MKMSHKKVGIHKKKKNQQPKIGLFKKQNKQFNEYASCFGTRKESW